MTGLLGEQASVTGSVRLDGQELLGLDERALADVRGRRIGMVFQDPLSSLTPIFDVGTQIVEAVRIHEPIGRDAARRRAVELLDLVGIPEPERRARSFPHEFSGGMRQRVMIAMAIAHHPAVLVADEPTTALDVTVQAEILDVLAEVRAETGAAMILISHDLGVVAGTADDVVVMYAGRAVETAPVEEVFARPRMPYTLGLLAAVPRVDGDRRSLVPIAGTPPHPVDLPPGCPFVPRCPVALDACAVKEPALAPVAAGGATAHAVACLRADEVVDGAIAGEPVFAAPPRPDAGDRRPRTERPEVLALEGVDRTFPLVRGSILRRRVGSVRAMDGVDLDVREGEAVGLVGESGSGKTTTLLEIMGIAAPQRGTIRIAGRDVAGLGRDERRALRRDLQMVFQDPMGSLDPRLTVADIIAEPLTAIDRPERGAVAARVAELMATVGLDPSHADRFPTAFSGGQRQRIGIARALATRPSVLVLDEPVSALDVSIQAGVITLLDRLRGELGLSYLFVAHDLAVVRHLCDRVAVMYRGRVVEVGPVDEVFDDPRHPYTEALLAAVPVPDPAVARARRHAAPPQRPATSPPAGPGQDAGHGAGCGFVDRCGLHAGLGPDARQRCRTETPALAGATVDADHRDACHIR
jgi:peptide/nickel transport system ATP-binding protein